MSKTRVLIVDDSVVIRRIVTDCLAEDPALEVVGTAPDGKIALAKLDQLKPDLVTLDVEMPNMDGLQTLTALRKTHPRLPVIMFSTLTERGAQATLEALSHGASDYITKPANIGSVGVAMQRIREELIPKIKALCRKGPVVTSALSTSVAPPPPARPPAPPTSGRPGLSAGPVQPELLAIGVSTGGPNALAALMPALGQNFPLPVVVVQHMPPVFTRLLAERITSVSSLQAREGVERAVLKPGELWVAPGGFHMEVQRSADGARLHLHEAPPENSCRPAVDVLFRSVAAVFGSRALAVVLTGMGHDGLRGCQTIREAGGQVLAQDEGSSVVWGMPGAVARAGLANKVLPLSEMADEINRRVNIHRPLVTKGSGLGASHQSVFTKAT